MSVVRFIPVAVKAVALGLGLGAALAAAQAGAANKAASAPASPAPSAQGSYRVIDWSALVPAGWDPAKEFKTTPQDALRLTDGSPRMQELMAKLREVYDNAPTVPAMDGQAVRLPGYVVPLESTAEGLREFLLVPYFGACIHTPPPPANQIIHVRAEPPVKGFNAMDAVWVNGQLKVDRQDSDMGASGYSLKAAEVQRYTANPRR